MPDPHPLVRTHACVTRYIMDADIRKGQVYWLSSALPGWKGGWRYVICLSVGPKWVIFTETGVKPYRIARESKDHSVGALWDYTVERRKPT